MTDNVTNFPGPRAQTREQVAAPPAMAYEKKFEFSVERAGADLVRLKIGDIEHLMTERFAAWFGEALRGVAARRDSVGASGCSSLAPLQEEDDGA